MWLVWLVRCIQCKDDEYFSGKLPFLLIHTSHYCLPRLPYFGLVWSSSHFSRTVLIRESSSSYPTLRQKSPFSGSFGPTWIKLIITWAFILLIPGPITLVLLASHSYYLVLNCNNLIIL